MRRGSGMGSQQEISFASFKMANERMPNTNIRFCRNTMGGLMARTSLHEQESHSSLVRVAIYARVSTAHNGQEPEMQTGELREYCERRGWKVTHEYVDIGISGAKESRPELDRLLTDAYRRRFDAVVVWRFDRFARSVSHLLRALETFKALSVEFVSLSEQVDTSTPT